ncbi:MAG TPA: TonB-dependent receptor [Pseudomonadales bacterium]|nr:TonB-dependent receptor [Pseudomonadales bacterium]
MSKSRSSMGARVVTRRLLGSTLVLALAPLSAAVHAASEAEPAARRQIEEVMVTAERRESTIQDTSISISAFNGEFLEDFGIRNQEDLANFVPATTIQPYDMAVRGVGRSFRALGGDPGVSTYLDNVYSEDFGIASTEGGLWDIDRIEVLRGPQGTLYGRNSVGGAINFVTKKPTDEFEGAVKSNIGTEGIVEFYGMVSGPLIEGKLNARATGVKRERDGVVEDLTPGNDDIDNYGDENYTLALEFLPFDNFSILMRGNERSYRRRMGAAGQTAGLTVLTENNMLTRDTETEVFGYRPILSSLTDPSASSFDVNDPNALTLLGANPNVNTVNPTANTFLNGFATPASANQAQLFSFTNPTTGETVIAQRLRPGVDPAADDEPSRNFGGGAGAFALAPTTDADSFEGNDLKSATNGNQDEFFDHQAFTFQAEWDVNEMLRVKYIGGYTDYFYDRTTDRDLTGNPNADETFYVSQENENFQHEVQFFFDFGDKATLTSGLFYYENRITQRGDFYSSVGEDRYAQPVDYGVNAAGVPNAAILGAVFPAQTDLFTSKAAYKALDADGQAAIKNGDSLASVGLWRGDNATLDGGCTNVGSGPTTCGTFLEYQTENRTEAFAFYNQAELFLTKELSLTLGIRYAEDKRSGEENVFLYSESTPSAAGLASGNIALGEAVLLSGLDRGDGNSFLLSEDVVPLGGPVVLPTTATRSLLEYNISTGAIDPATLQQTGNGVTRLAGVPFGLTFYRPVEETFDDVTWRVNLDWEPNETTLLYAGVTTGYRAGGFNLANLSNDAVYDQEEITSYEIGWKDQLFDRTVQLNMSAYFYDYQDIHASVDGFSNALGATVNNVVNVPEAEVYGLEADVLWLASESITLGGNFSVTKAEYTSDVKGQVDTNSDGVPDTLVSLAQDEFNADVPASLFPTPGDRAIDIDGNNMILVPEIKWTLFGMYSLPLGNRGSLEFRTNVSYTDEVYFSVENNPDDVAPEYYRWDGRVTWTSPQESFIVSGYVNNILDEIGVRQIARYAENQNYLRSATTTLPRIMGVELTYKFGAY